LIELQGKYNTAKVSTDNVEQEAILQILKPVHNSKAAEKL